LNSDLDSSLVSNLNSSLDSNLVSKIVGDLISREILKETTLILSHLSVIQSKRKDILGAIGVTDHSFNAKRSIDPLLEMDLIKRPEGVSLQSPNLKYQITSKGKALLNYLEKQNNY